MRACLNAPFGAWCFLTAVVAVERPHLIVRLNAPYGAWCFLTLGLRRLSATCSQPRLNAPYGARCFLTVDQYSHHVVVAGLNAPYGARCFLTSAIEAFAPVAQEMS